LHTEKHEAEQDEKERKEPVNKQTVLVLLLTPHSRAHNEKQVSESQTRPGGLVVDPSPRNILKTFFVGV